MGNHRPHKPFTGQLASPTDTGEADWGKTGSGVAKRRLVFEQPRHMHHGSHGQRLSDGPRPGLSGIPLTGRAPNLACHDALQPPRPGLTEKEPASSHNW
jgi:hypothetical protein